MINNSRTGRAALQVSMRTVHMEKRHTPGIEHDGVEEMTACLDHDRQNTSEIGTISSATLITDVV